MSAGCFITGHHKTAGVDQKGVDKMFETVMKIKRNLDGEMIISIDDHDAWRVSEELKILMLKDIRKNLGGEYDSLALRLLKKIICI